MTDPASILAAGRLCAGRCGWSVTDITPDPKTEGKVPDLCVGLTTGATQFNFLARVPATEAVFKEHDPPQLFAVTGAVGPDGQVTGWEAVPDPPLPKPQAVFAFVSSRGVRFAVNITSVSQMTDQAFRAFVSY